jgi:hypothetical protein
MYERHTKNYDGLTILKLKNSSSNRTDNKNRMLELLSFHRSSLTECLAHKPTNTRPSIRPEELVRLGNAFLIENDREKTRDLSRTIHPRDSTAGLRLSYVDWSGLSGAAHSAQLFRERKQESEKKQARDQLQKQLQYVTNYSGKRRSTSQRKKSFEFLDPPPTFTTKSRSGRDLFASKKILLDEVVSVAHTSSHEYEKPGNENATVRSSESQKCKSRRYERRLNPLGGSLHSNSPRRTARSGRPALISSLSTTALVGATSSKGRGGLVISDNTTESSNQSVRRRSERPVYTKAPSSLSLVPPSHPSRPSSSSSPMRGGRRHHNHMRPGLHRTPSTNSFLENKNSTTNESLAW